MENLCVKKENMEVRATYKPKEIMRILGLGKTATYDLIEDSFVNNKNFKVFKIGKQYIIPKFSFDNWFNG